MTDESAADNAIEIVDNRDEDRYELRIGGELAGIVQYRSRDDRIGLIHTEIDRDFEGQGLASRLIRHTLDDARARGLSVLPYCPFVKDYIRRHPDYLALVPETKRRSFGL